MDGMEMLDAALKEKADLPIVVISGHGSTETAVEAVKKGAFDYIAKPPDLTHRPSKKLKIRLIKLLLQMHAY